ncbi:MAG: hypothetical protein FJ267_16545 [Planctomycetes bacterium]|nr:hypothetical protein [Planctomycetota bacterium]
MKNGTCPAYWALVESNRTATGPRKRVVAWLGKLDEAGRLGVQQVADGVRHPSSQSSDARSPSSETSAQPSNSPSESSNDSSQQIGGRQLRIKFADENDAAVIEPRWGEVVASAVVVENVRQFGAPWLALHSIRVLQLDTFLDKVIPEGRERVPWDVTSLILIIAKLLEPSSEMFIIDAEEVRTRDPQKRLAQ